MRSATSARRQGDDRRTQGGSLLTMIDHVTRSVMRHRQLRDGSVHRVALARVLL
jgi:hypothetical protein